MDEFLRDLKHAARMFLGTPGFTITAIGALTLGIASNTAIFSVVNTVLLKPFAYRDPQQIVMFQILYKGIRSGSASPTEFNWWRQQTQAFQDISAYDFPILNWTGESIPEQIPGMHASADFFRLCGASVVQGRTFTAADDLPHAPKTVVLAYSFWQRQFAGDPRVIGRRMTLDGERYEIIGVVGPRLEDAQMAERSTLFGDIEIHERPDVYLPFQIDPNSADQGHFFNVAGRLKPGATLAAANTQLQASYQEYGRKWPNDSSQDVSFAVQPLQGAIVGGVRSTLLILLGAVGFVLLIACANVANLLLARAAGRKREIAIRTAVGAGTGRILRQLLTESVMLSLAGGGLGLVAGYACIRAILRLLPGSIPRIGTAGANVGLDWRVLGFTLGLSLVTGILFGLAPAWQSSCADWNSTVARTRAAGRTSHMRALLVATEVALAVVLLIGAALLIRTFLAIRQVNPGFNAQNVLTMRMSLTGPEFEKPVAVAQVIHEGLRRIRALPGVEAVATTCCVPLEDRWQAGFQVVGWPTDRRAQAGWTLAAAGYFEVLGIPVVRGRTFTERDETGPPVAIINQTLAKRLWPDRDPLNYQITIGKEPPRQIVGVVADVHEGGLDHAPGPNLYMPSVTREGMLAWVMRTRVAPMSLSSAIQKELREASGGLPVAQVRTMEEIVAQSRTTGNFTTLVLTIFGCSALLLGAIGIYGLMAYSVAQRTQEMGIRLALGAEPAHIRRIVVVQGLRPALAGLLCGLAAALALTRFLTSFLFGVKPWDPIALVLVPVILTGVALFALWIPAMRASRIDPIEALRGE
jgi:putative ABC transport system permease protein